MSKTEQKAEMTKEEFVDIIYDTMNPILRADKKDEKAGIMSDLRSVIRGELIREADELKKQNPCPESVFIPIEAETLRKVIKYLKQGGYSPDALFGHWGRTVWNNCVERLKENNNQ